MGLGITPGAGATLGTVDGPGGHVQLVHFAGRLPMGTVLTLAVGTAVSSIPVPASAMMALLVLDVGGAVRWKDDGVDPNASLGLPLSAAVGSLPAGLEIHGATAMQRFRMLSALGVTSSVAQVAFYRFVV